MADGVLARGERAVGIENNARPAIVVVKTAPSECACMGVDVEHTSTV
jgi:hypothetical protein